MTHDAAATHRQHTPTYTYDTSTRLYHADCACREWQDWHPYLDQLTQLHNQHRRVYQRITHTQPINEARHYQPPKPKPAPPESRVIGPPPPIAEYEDAITRLHPIRTRGGIIRWVA